jgi:hypothetical protein
MFSNGVLFEVNNSLENGVLLVIHLVVLLHNFNLLDELVLAEDLAFFSSENAVEYSSDRQSYEEGEGNKDPEQVRKISASTKSMSLADSLRYDFSKNDNKSSGDKETNSSRSQVRQEDRKQRINSHISQ